MFKKSILIIVAISAFSVSAVHAGWERYPYLSSTYDQKIKGKLVARTDDYQGKHASRTLSY
jgi:hypothetical protein